jgi:hypothetical protein
VADFRDGSLNHGNPNVSEIVSGDPKRQRHRTSPAFYLWLVLLIAFGLLGAYVAASCLLSTSC